MIGLGVASAAMLGGNADAAEMKVISNGSFRSPRRAWAGVRKSTGHKVTAIFAGTDDIVRRLGAGETLDIVIAPAVWITI